MSIKKNVDGNKYFTTFDGYNHPVKVDNEISKNDISKYNAYYIAYYNKDLLIRVEKILNNKIEFTYTYTYDSSKCLVKTVVEREGKKNVILLKN